MQLRSLRYWTVLVSALAMGMAFSHLLEMPQRLSWEPRLWIETTVTGDVFRLFGSIGAALEVGAVLLAILLAVATYRQSPQEFAPSAVGAVLLAGAHLLWWLFVYPVNSAFATWTPLAYPTDFEAWRMQWEYAHAVRALLFITGLAAILSSALPSPAGPKGIAQHDLHRAAA